MQPAKNTVARTRHIILDKRSADAELGVTAELIGFHEKTALIAKELGFYDENFGDICFNNIHL